MPLGHPRDHTLAQWPLGGKPLPRPRSPLPLLSKAHPPTTLIPRTGGGGFSRRLAQPKKKPQTPSSLGYVGRPTPRPGIHRQNPPALLIRHPITKPTNPSHPRGTTQGLRECMLATPAQAIDGSQRGGQRSAVGMGGGGIDLGLMAGRAGRHTDPANAPPHPVHLRQNGPGQIHLGRRRLGQLSGE